MRPAPVRARLEHHLELMLRPGSCSRGGVPPRPGRRTRSSLVEYGRRSGHVPVTGRGAVPDRAKHASTQVSENRAEQPAGRCPRSPARWRSRTCRESRPLAVPDASTSGGARCDSALDISPTVRRIHSRVLPALQEGRSMRQRIRQARDCERCSGAPGLAVTSRREAPISASRGTTGARVSKQSGGCRLFARAIAASGSLAACRQHRFEHQLRCHIERR